MRSKSWKGGALVSVLVAAVALAVVSLPAAARTSSGPYSPPFTQCPPVGVATSCTLLIVFGPNGTTLLGDSSAGAIDGDEEGDDFLIGVQNDSTTTLHSIALSSNEEILKFEVESDAICAHITCTWPARYGYEGPNTSFVITDYSNGIVNFPDGLAPGASTYFALEGASLTYATAPPAFNKTAVVDSTTGDVCYYKPGAAITPGGCIPVTAETAIRVGSVIDTTKGRAKLRTAEGTSSASGGRFKLNEVKIKRKRYTVLTLKGNRNVCKTKGYRLTGTRRAAAVSKEKKPKILQHLFVKAQGSFRTQGSYASATVRGTAWSTADLCGGTLVRVLRGAVEVHDFVLNKTVIVKGGHSYFAKAP